MENHLKHVKISQQHLKINKTSQKFHEHFGKMNEDRVKFSQKHQQKHEHHGKINENHRNNGAQRA